MDMDQQPAGSSLPSNAAGSEDQQNGSSNTNGNANSEVAEVDQLLSTSVESIAAAIPFQLNYTQAQDQVTWLSLGSGYVHNLLGQSVVASTSSVINLSDQQDLTLGINSEASAIYSRDSSSQRSTISSPSSTTTSSSPPGSAAFLCSPPSSLLSHQGMFVEVLSRTSPAGGSQDDDEESYSQQVVCLWDECNQEFSSLSQLVSHLDKGHTLSMSQYRCYWRDCPRNLKPFDARYKLITHLRCHTGEKPFRCDVPTCNRCFSRLENLKLHVRTHTGEKPYECHYKECSKKFNNTSDRAKHMKTHVMRKPYACKYPGCEKSYTDPSSMRKHIKYSHKLKERQERGSSSGSSTETAPTSKLAPDASRVAPPEASSQSGSSVRTPSLSPSSFVFHGPTVTALSPPTHASLPKESARIAHSSSNFNKKLVNGTPLIAGGPIVSSPPQHGPTPQLIPIPLVQLPPGAALQHQLLGLMPGVQQAQKSMILMPSTSSESSQLLLQPVAQALPELSSDPPVSSSLSESAGSSDQPEPSSDGAANIEAQLRQKILQLQQELSHTQNLLAHQNAAMVQQKTLLAQPPVIIQQIPNTNSSSIENSMPVRPVTTVAQNGNVTVSNTQYPTSTTSLGISLPSLPLVTSVSGPQIIPIVNSQGFQFLYAPPVPPSSV